MTPPLEPRNLADDSLEPTEPSPKERRHAGRTGGFAILVIAILLVLGSARVLIARGAAAQALQSETAEQQKIFVAFTHPHSAGSDGTSQVTLPGTLLGGRETTVYARSSGYLRRWNTDIGARVQAGQILAEIETPELEQQILQAHANARQTEANLALAKSSFQRWEALRKDELVTQQEVEERHSAVDQQTAALASAQAEVARLESLRDFEHVAAPFAGIITHRNIDVGSLINAGNGGSAQALFQLASTDRLRLELYVPQAYANKVKVGMPVDITQTELPGQHFQGKVGRTAGAIDNTTRTLQVEIDLPNPAGTLIPGSYVQAALPIRAGESLTVPANALLFRAEGPRIAVIGEGSKTHLAAITLGRDLGKTIEIRSGLQMSDRVVLNPPDSLTDGDVVEATEVRAAAPAAPGPGKNAAKQPAAIAK